MTKDNQDFNENARETIDFGVWMFKQLRDHYDSASKKSTEEFMKEFRAERSRSSLPEGVVNAIQSFINKNVNEERTWEWAKSAFDGDKHRWVAHMLSLTNRFIYSVVNSKGEAFQAPDVTKQGEIHAFSLNHDKTEVLAKMCDVNGHYSFIGVHLLLKPEPAFSITTEDGVVITDRNQKLAAVSKSRLVLQATMHNADTGEHVPALHNDFWLFSTEEAAREYVRLHTKSFSLNDVKKGIAAVVLLLRRRDTDASMLPVETIYNTFTSALTDKIKA